MKKEEIEELLEKYYKKKEEVRQMEKVTDKKMETKEMIEDCYNKVISINRFQEMEADLQGRLKGLLEKYMERGVQAVSWLAHRDYISAYELLQFLVEPAGGKQVGVEQGKEAKEEPGKKFEEDDEFSLFDKEFDGVRVGKEIKEEETKKEDSSKDPFHIGKSCE